MDGACLELAESEATASLELGTVDEGTLIRLAQRGDRAAFDALVRRYDRKVLRLILGVVRSADDAPDVFQEIFLKIYRALPRFNFQASFYTWLHRVAVNACLDYLRRQHARPEVQAPVQEEGAADYFHEVVDERPGLNPEQALRAQEIGRRLERALAQLNPRERMVFELRHYQGLKLQVIGALLGSTEETAKNCLFRATQKLRAELADLV